jgi:hypothetical protein
VHAEFPPRSTSLGGMANLWSRVGAARRDRTGVMCALRTVSVSCALGAWKLPSTFQLRVSGIKLSEPVLSAWTEYQKLDAGGR